MAPTLVEHVVADAGAFLKQAQLQEFGQNIYTLREVLDEIRDRTTRRSLAVLPYQLTFREPNPEHIRTVTEFSKKTGDYPSLSATDIKVLALTYQLQLEHVGSQNLKAEPDLKVTIQSTQRHPEAPVHIAGFHLPSRRTVDTTNTGHTWSEPSTQTDLDQFNSFQFWRQPLPSLQGDLLDLLDPTDPDQQPDIPASSETDEDFSSFRFWRDPVPSVDQDLLALVDVGGASTQVEERRAEPGLAEDQSDDDDDGWITPSNIRQVKMESSDWTEAADVRVGCLTTDFAMQNVLIQMGLHVLSVGGLVIRRARSYILRCHACFRTTSNMSKAFCPHCGNQTLKKLAVTVGNDGSIQMHFSKNPKVMNPRGTRYSLPLPRGGKHAADPHLVEDQRFPQQRLSRKARQKTDVFDPDYLAGASPFCQNDIYSRAANLQIRDGESGAGRRRANPNAARRKFLKKK
ncbi:RNA-binding protein NOB1 isoform X1 [Xiphophorus maculatus]|uniref:RNA-binding protein NOB1 isoform X1 n=1 Tax=Xiphophorus maculatus TaxID=8083 RepID=UPI0003B47CFE|nr:RNA-binding protein NOB1 isoform X1 [Xiphophorus maculatus]